MRDRKTEFQGFKVTKDEDTELRKLASVNRMDISEILHKGMHLMFKLLKTK